LVLLTLMVATLPLACGGDDEAPPPPSKKIKKPTDPTDPTDPTNPTDPTDPISPQDPNTPPETSDEFANLYPSAYCTVASPCCGQKNLNSNQQDCEKAVFASLLLIKDTGTFNKTKGQACIKQLKGLSGSSACSTLEAGIPDCEGAIEVAPPASNLKKPGDTCASSEECEPPAQGEVRCEEVGLEPKKICQHVLEGGAGSTPCVGDTRQTLVVNEDPKLSVGTVYRCAESFTCDASSRECVAAAPLGSSCFASFECTKDTHCAGGSCVASGDSGAICGLDEECKSGLFCSSKGTCAAFTQPGAPCTGDPDSRCLDGACVNSVCSGGASSSQLFCP
jgi:hypothetical protein